MESTTDVYIYGYTGNEESLSDFARVFSGQKDYFIVALPGFSDGAELNHEQQSDACVYAELVWDQIKSRSKHPRIRIIGHSHGAILAYCLAVAHPNSIESIVLICPVSEPKFIVKSATRALLGFSRVLGTGFVLKVISRPLLVDIVTKELRAKSWSNKAYIKISDIRRREAMGYNRAVIDCIKQVLPFKSKMDRTESIVKAVILSTNDDKVAGSQDHEWYGDRLSEAIQIRTYGGHQCLVADPQRIADIIRANEVQ